LKLKKIALGLLAALAGHTLLDGLEAVGDALRPLFSWNPQAASAPRRGPGLLNRLSRAGRALFSWNPQAHRS